MIYARLAIGVIVLGLLAWAAIADFDAGKHSGASAIQAQWDADKIKIQKAADTEIAAQTKAKEDALAANEVIANDYQAQLLAARALSSSLSQQLRQYAASHSAGGGDVSKAGGGQGTTPASSQASDVQLTNALGAALAECSANTAQLDALIVELKPQL